MVRKKRGGPGWRMGLSEVSTTVYKKGYIVGGCPRWVPLVKKRFSLRMQPYVANGASAGCENSLFSLVRSLNSGLLLHVLYWYNDFSMVTPKFCQEILRGVVSTKHVWFRLLVPNTFGSDKVKVPSFVWTRIQGNGLFLNSERSLKLFLGFWQCSERYGDVSKFGRARGNIVGTLSKMEFQSENSPVPHSLYLGAQKYSRKK